MSQLAPFSEGVAKLVPAVSTADFPELLISTLESLVTIDDASILLYPGTDLPVIEHFRNAEESTLPVFLKGAFLLDPYYLAAQEGQFGVFRLNELAPSRFREGEYYKSWYRSCGYQDEAGYLIPIGNKGFVNIALGKTSTRATFTKKEMETLREVLPAVTAFAQQHWGGATSAREDTNLRAQLNSALKSFGSSMLTERETQVINLVLHGHSTKTLAEKLSISMETVKLHRKHAYAKLEVSSQAELFYLFLDSVMSARDYEGGDTLVAYMQSPRSN
jgi:DNA-binding CsgD family transcriptional regulator